MQKNTKHALKSTIHINVTYKYLIMAKSQLQLLFLFIYGITRGGNIFVSSIVSIISNISHSFSNFDLE